MVKNNSPGGTEKILRVFVANPSNCEAVISSIFVVKSQLLFRSISILLSLQLVSVAVYAQVRFSFATDLDAQRSFKKEQQYWSIGHTLQTQFHIGPKEGVYAWLSYYSKGKFNNEVTATAKSPSTLPQQINYTNSANMRFKQVSVGWKKYLKGTFDAKAKWNLYACAGFGLVFGRVDNTQSAVIDTALYNVPIRDGRANFKRLTIDGCLGGELPLGADLFLYTEGRAWIPTTDYPSKYIFVNKDAPLIGMINFGIRVLF